ncbi:MAG: acetate--CoA ligase family protein [Thermodesulfobacteriota bacterium]
MRGFFHPQSVAVIGVSPRPGNLGRNIVANLEIFGFPGRVHYVSPRGGEYKGQPIYTDPRDLPETPDLAVILTPAATVPGWMQACGEKGIKRVVVESGGFSELDSGRGELEAAMKAAAAQYGLRFIGPNCIGVISTHQGLSVPFPILEEAVPKGGLSLIMQSGGIGLTYLHRAAYEGIGIAKFASVGNKLNVNEGDLLEFYLEDPDTKVVLLYLESIVDGRRLCDLIRKSDKPVVVHKSNIAPLSNKIAQSHTAALANDDFLVEEALAQAGAVRAHTVNDCLAIVKGLCLPKPKGRRLAIVSRSGGHAVVAADAAFRQGMELPELPRSYFEPIQEAMRASVIKLQNPLDLGDLFHFELYKEIVRGALAQDNVDAVVLVHGYRGPEIKPSRELMRTVGELVREYDKPVTPVILATQAEVDQAKALSGLPIFSAPEEAIMALAAAGRAGGRRQAERLGCAGMFDTARARQVLRAASPDGALELPEALHLIAAAGVPVAPFLVAADPAEAARAAAQLGFPVALKAVGGAVSHKTEAGGVVLGLDGPEAVEREAKAMTKRLGVDRLVVMSMITGGSEVIVGGKQDPAFGAVVLFGLGGVTAEALRDVRLCLAPVDDAEAGAMLDGLKGAALLKGFRGRPKANRAAVLSVIMQVSNLMASVPEILELDLNPVLVGPGGAVAVDARARVKPAKPLGH